MGNQQSLANQVVTPVERREGKAYQAQALFVVAPIQGGRIGSSAARDYIRCHRTALNWDDIQPNRKGNALTCRAPNVAPRVGRHPISMSGSTVPMDSNPQSRVPASKIPESMKNPSQFMEQSGAAKESKIMNQESNKIRAVDVLKKTFDKVYKDIPRETVRPQAQEPAARIQQVLNNIEDIRKDGRTMQEPKVLLRRQIEDYERLLKAQVDSGHLQDFQQAQIQALINSDFIETLRKQVELSPDKQIKDASGTANSESLSETEDVTVERAERERDQQQESKQILIDYIQEEMVGTEIIEMVEKYVRTKANGAGLERGEGKLGQEGAGFEKKKILSVQDNFSLNQESGTVSEIDLGAERDFYYRQVTRLHHIILNFNGFFKSSMPGLDFAETFYKVTEQMVRDASNPQEEVQEIQKHLAVTASVVLHYHNKKAIDLRSDLEFVQYLAQVLPQLGALEGVPEGKESHLNKEEEIDGAQGREPEIDFLIAKKKDSLDAFLSDPAVQETFGAQAIHQHQQVIEKLRQEARTAVESLAVNDKLHIFLKELHELKKYEKNKALKDLEEAGEAPRKDYASFVDDDLDLGDAGRVDQTMQKIIEHQLKRLEQFMRLESNKMKPERVKALQTYRGELLEFEHKGVMAIKFLVDKGEALEQWQELLAQNFAQSSTFLENDGLTEEESKQKALEEIMKATQNMNGELRGIFKDGKEVRGVEPGGWGSHAHIRVDKKTGEVDHAERVATSQDALFAAHYISFLESQFQELRKKEDVSIKSPGQEQGDEPGNGLAGLLKDIKDGSQDTRHESGAADAAKMEAAANVGERAMNHLADQLQPNGNASDAATTILPGAGAEYTGDLSGASLLSFARGRSPPPNKEHESSPALGSREQMANVIKNKEQELKRKLKIKQNLKKIGSQVDDQRFADVAEYLSTVAKQHQEFFSNPLSATTNIKIIVNQNQSLSRQEKNTIFHLHNTASEDETYGSRLFNYCQELLDRGKVDADFPNQIYVLSVDWPLDFAVDLIPSSRERQDSEAELSN